MLFVNSPHAAHYARLSSRLRRPIQRLRINLSGDISYEEPTIKEPVNFPIPTGGSQCFVLDPSIKRLHDSLQVHKAIKRNEDIVFEGHRIQDNNQITRLEYINLLSLAMLTSSTPKPNNWFRRIILFGCQCGNIAPAVSQEYYRITRTPVAVIGPKESIVVFGNNKIPS